MFTDGFDAVLPAIHGVTGVAFGAELAAMDVGMAVRALAAYVREDQLCVAQAALHLLVHAPQRELGLTIVVELGNSANWSPAR